MKTVKQQITDLDYILTGTIIKKYGPCGKAGCRCAYGKKNWHGPYYIWTRKENGKTITKSLTSAQAQFCKKAIGNMQKLKTQIERWKRESVKSIEKWSRAEN
jgi:hypothetical protein